jgi:hypothetical protein
MSPVNSAPRSRWLRREEGVIALVAKVMVSHSPRSMFMTHLQHKKLWNIRKIDISNVFVHFFLLMLQVQHNEGYKSDRQVRGKRLAINEKKQLF